ncbi:Hsp20/alpha crystallin family protein [Chondromyces crocatus]|uniref:Heat-shock protein n=1 Tax=Chondromyces crocatus TaxID=52 RepID=A0A0K1E8W2_CHOCO|nr:Hsp20/alpha crystallin family protein [Chondromyces crocatus]AKT37305.1 heat-shock protein [Chondromyces crocatus]
MSTENNVTNRERNQAETIQQRPAVAPRVDIYENADELLVLADLPGVLQDGLSVHLEKGELTIEGRRVDAARVAPGNDVAGLWDYRRTFLVPRGIDSAKISADLKEGVLSIHLPKAEAVKPRQIPIKVN